MFQTRSAWLSFSSVAKSPLRAGLQAISASGRATTIGLTREDTAPASTSENERRASPGFLRSYNLTTPSSPWLANCWPLNGLGLMEKTLRVLQVMAAVPGDRRSYALSHLPPMPATRRGSPTLAFEARNAADVTVSEEPS